MTLKRFCGTLARMSNSGGCGGVMSAVCGVRVDSM